jgi:hypothetical protein
VRGRDKGDDVAITCCVTVRDAWVSPVARGRDGVREGIEDVREGASLIAYATLGDDDSGGLWQAGGSGVVLVGLGVAGLWT